MVDTARGNDPPANMGEIGGMDGRMQGRTCVFGPGMAVQAHSFVFDLA